MIIAPTASVGRALAQAWAAMFTAHDLDHRTHSCSRDVSHVTFDLTPDRGGPYGRNIDT